MARDFFASVKSSPQREAALRQTLAMAIDHMGRGHLDAAADALAAEGGAALKTPVGQNIIGDIHLKQGQPAEALRAFEAAVKLAPQMPEAHCNRGVALQELGRLEDALSAEDRALRLRPEYATAHFNRGNVLKAMFRLDEAVTAYDRALRAQPKLAEAYLNRGLANFGRGRHLEAVGDFGQALAGRPNYVAALVGRAGAFRELGEFRQAFAAIDAAAAIEPDNVDAALMRCGALVNAERFAEALTAADALIARFPEDGRAHGERALALRKLQRLDEALAAADAAVRFAPKDPEAQTTRGIILGELSRFDESAEALAAAARLGARGRMLHHSLALTQDALGRYTEAAASYERAVALGPDDAETHHHRALFLLSQGDFANGWAEHEWRLKGREHGHADKLKLAPPWRGEDLAGKKLLVYAEQGNGDTIQFARYLRPLAERGGSITLVVQEPLRRLFEANFPGIDVTGALGMRGGFDYRVSLMSLPDIFSTTVETVPATIPYLVADEERVAKWRGRIGTEGFRIGIAWQGNPKYPRDRDRSIALAEFAPLVAIPGVRLISLQSAPAAAQVKDAPPGLRVETLGEEIVNNPDGFREVAAAMMALDLMVMSDTGPAHLAGALGRPMFLALSARADWRWMHERPDTPWYPTMRLFRQKTPRDWPGVFAEIAEAVEEMSAARAT